MTIYPGGGSRLGLGLWNHVAATMIVEISMYMIAVYLYGNATRARDRIGSYAFFLYAALLLVLLIGRPL